MRHRPQCGIDGCTGRAVRNKSHRARRCAVHRQQEVEALQSSVSSSRAIVSSLTASSSSSSSSPVPPRPIDFLPLSPSSASLAWQHYGVRYLPSSLHQYSIMHDDMRWAVECASSMPADIWTNNELTPDGRGATTNLELVLNDAHGSMGRDRILSRIDAHMKHQASIATGMTSMQMRE